MTIGCKHGNFYYTFKSSLQEQKGKVTFNRTYVGKEMSINFEGIKWADYQGDINNLDEEEPEISENDIPIGISGLLSDEGISIQNYGNAMNSYQKLNGSGEKYLLFKSTDTLDYPNPGYSISY